MLFFTLQRGAAFRCCGEFIMGIYRNKRAGQRLMCFSQSRSTKLPDSQCLRGLGQPRCPFRSSQLRVLWPREARHICIINSVKHLFQQKGNKPSNHPEN